MSFEKVVRVNYASAPSCLTGTNVARDFDRFHLPTMRLHHKALHGAGVAAGLELAVGADRTSVVVRPGLAIDGDGRMIVLADGGPAQVGDPPAPAPAPVSVPVA